MTVQVVVEQSLGSNVVVLPPRMRTWAYVWADVHERARAVARGTAPAVESKDTAEDMADDRTLPYTSHTPAQAASQPVHFFPPLAASSDNPSDRAWSLAQLPPSPNLKTFQEA